MAVSLRMAGEGKEIEREPEPAQNSPASKNLICTRRYRSHVCALHNPAIAKYESCDMLPSVDCKLIVKAKVQDLPRPAPRAFIKS